MKIFKIYIKNTSNKIFSNFLIRNTLTVTVLNIIGRSAGFVVPFFIAKWFGISAETDAFFFSYSIIIYLSNIFAPVLESVIVPYILDRSVDRKAIGEFVGKIICVSETLVFIMMLLAIILIQPLLSILTKYNLAELLVIRNLFYGTIPIFILTIFGSILSGSLNAKRYFVLSATSPVYRAFIVIIVICLFKKSFGIYSVPLGYVIGEIGRSLILLSFIRGKRLFNICLSFKFDHETKCFLKTASYSMLGMVAVGFNPVINKIMVSWLPAGSVSVLEYADRLYTALIVLLSSGVTVTLLSHWSEKIKEIKVDALKKEINGIALKSIFFTLPVLLVAIFLSHLFFSFIFDQENISFEKIQLIKRTWFYYLLGFIPTIVNTIYVRGFLAMKETNILMRCAVYMCISNVFLNFFTMNFLGVAGIALSTSLIALMSLIYLNIKMNYHKMEIEYGI